MIEKDMVNTPEHYKHSGSVECIDAIEAATSYGFEFYLRRYRYKNGLEDLEKARWYLNKLIEKVRKEKEDVLL